MRPFFVIWTGQAFSFLGSQLVQFALIWWLTWTTGSATVLAFASVTSLLPAILIGPFAGALVDRWNRRIVMIVADAVIALATVALAVIYKQDVVQVWHIFALMFIRAVGGEFHWPAMLASTTLMVPKQHLSRVAGMDTTLEGLANILVPPMGALVLALLPMQGILAIDVVTAMLAITPLFFIPIPQPVRAAAAHPTKTPETVGAKPSVLADMREGFRFIRGWKGMVILMALLMLSNAVVAGAASVFPLMITEYFRGGAVELAWLESITGVGIILGGITLGVWGGFRRRIVTAMLTGMLAGIALIAFGLTPATAFPLAVGVHFFVAFLNSISRSAFGALLQATIPPEMQGRVFTLFGSLTKATAPLGLAFAGPVADTLGVRFWILIAGISYVILPGSTFFIPAIMRIEDKTPLGNEVADPSTPSGDE
jgi:DHA3 family macrolide efflux protein-like MFS transporter